MIGATFDSTKTGLLELLRYVDSGKMQLPDFQRGWVWDDERIRSLLESISVSFPIGAVMILETGGEGVTFKPRPVEGTDDSLARIGPDTLILDGQQRLTSLYQALMSPVPVQTKDPKGKAIERHYYLDMERAVDPEADETVLSVPADRIVRTFRGEVKTDLSQAEGEYGQSLFPADQVFDAAGWRRGYNQHWNYDSQKMELFDTFERLVIKRFEGYQIPVITLGKETPKEAVCLVFEKVNTGGVTLSVFELLTASFAAENFQLRDDWRAREERLKGEHPVLRGIQSDDFLQVISLLTTMARRRNASGEGTGVESAPGIGCRRRDILRLGVADYEAWADRAETGFIQAARFLHHQNIFNAKDLPYRTQLVPLAAIMVDLGKEAETDTARQQIARWFWSGILGELYGGAIETRFARDLPEVVAMVRGGDGVPSAIGEANFQANRLLTLRTRNSAAYKGVHALLMRQGGRDFRTGERIEAQTFFDDKIDIHHIFPKAWCQKQGIADKTYDSIINKAAVSAYTNRKVGGRAPSVYLGTLERDASIVPERMDEILASHQIPAQLLRLDDFWGFYATRAENLLKLIEDALGTPVVRDDGLFTSSAPVEEYDDGPVEWEVDEPLEVDAG